MSFDIELAKLLKERNNKTPIGVVEGTVISINPLKISLFENKVIIDDARTCGNYTAQLNDNVLCIADATGQIFYIIDKVNGVI